MSIAAAMTLGALLVAGLTGAAQASTPHSRQPPHPASLVEHNTELGREFVVLENERDKTRQQRLADSIVSPDYIQHNAIVAPGRAGLLAFLQSLPTVMPDVRFPSGQKLEWDGMDIWTVRGGKLYEHWDQFDWTRALIQLGVQGLPQPFVQAASRPVNR
jgi:predicted SnoaL-like aldol condensation-catalyzing enzyme